MSEKTDEGRLHPLVADSRRKDIWTSLLVHRAVNAVILCTFFQPDEFYQAQEPAWKLAFGGGSHSWLQGAYDGAWITWDWHYRLRSSLYPLLLGAIYKVFRVVCNFLFPPVLTTKLLLGPPKIVGAVSAALMDYYTWQLSERILGAGSKESTAVLYLAASSPWQWFVSTRTFSNCLETTLTIMALYYWPWAGLDGVATSKSPGKMQSNLTYAFLTAGFATILRPTNILIWLPIGIFTLVHASPGLIPAMIRKGAVAGLAVLAISLASDFFYYGELTFSPLNFLNLNVSEGIADFYGTMRPDYYFTEGIPLLLTTALPLAILGLFDAVFGRISGLSSDKANVLRCLAITSLFVPLAFTFLGHKEVRFIYPILPILLILSGPAAKNFFTPTSQGAKAALSIFLLINATLAIYFGTFHGRGVMNVTSFLRSEHERHNPRMVRYGETSNLNATTVGFLMPCHSVPWRSNLIYPGIEAWALTCEPPLDMSNTEKSAYLDEADVFYQDPQAWLRSEFGAGKRRWPQYLVFFQQLENDMKAVVTAHNYEEAWRGFNSLVHDDWRRKGDVIVWVNTSEGSGPEKA